MSEGTEPQGLVGAAKSGDLERVRALLDAGTDPDERNAEGGTALMHAAVGAHLEKGVYRDEQDWRRQFEEAPVYVQWDPERTLRGAALDYKSIQVGLSRRIIERYVGEWSTGIQDMTPLVRKMHGLIQLGQATKAKGFLPKERVYPVTEMTARRLGMNR